MNLRDYRNLFVVCSLGLSVLAFTPVLYGFVPLFVGESFSELSILGPGHLAKDYPFNVRANVEESLYVAVGNHMGESTYYRVNVKLRNQTQSFASDTVPSMLDPLYEFSVFLLNGEKWEKLIRFKFLEISREVNSVRVRKLMVNDVIFIVDYSSEWDSENNGFYFQLFFELWLYDITLRSIKYNERSVGIWLNMTV